MSVRLWRQREQPLTALWLIALLALALSGCVDREVTSPNFPVPGPRFDQDAAGPVVTSLADPGEDGTCDDTECTLREAIALAAPGATIRFAPGLSGTITLNAFPPVGLIMEKDLVIEGPGADRLAITAVPGSPVFNVRNGPTVEISGLTVRDVVHFISAINVQANSHLTLRGVRLTHNQLTAPALPYYGPIYRGGAVNVANGGDLTLVNSTVDSNSVWAYYAGGIGGINATITILNSTFSGNKGITTVAIEGDDILRIPAGTLTITNSTIFGNRAAAQVATIGPGRSATIRGSVVGGNLSEQGVDCFLPASATVVDGGYNVADDGSCFTAESSRSNVDLLLGPLAGNGAPIPTHALLPGSPALDLVPSGADGCDGFGTDQRGVLRPQGPGCDAGAFEARAYSFPGFLGPIDNLPVLNQVKAGQAVPVKFSLGGDQGLGVLAAGYPTSQDFPCDGAAPTSLVEETVTSGASGLSYDLLTGTYTYVWKTNKAWANTCRRLTLRLADEAGTMQIAEFRFTK